MIDEKKLIKAIFRTPSEEAKRQQSCLYADGYFDGKIQREKEIVDIINAQPKADWIPCEKRLPENLEQVLVWYEYFRYGDYNCMYQTYGIGYHLDGFWSGDVSGRDARCIAWQPLPEPYREDKQ